MGFGCSRQDDGDIGTLKDALEGVADLSDTVAKILPAVTGRQNDFAVLVALGERATEYGETGVSLDHRAAGQKRVDDRIAGDMNLSPGHVLEIQHLGGASGRREMLVGNLGYDLAVHLFRPRLINIAAAQAGLDMRNRDPPVVSGERADHGAGRVALHDDPVRPNAVIDLADRQQQPGTQLIQRLVGFHDVEIEVWLDLAERENRIEEIAMLGGYANGGSAGFPER